MKATKVSKKKILQNSTKQDFPKWFFSMIQRLETQLNALLSAVRTLAGSMMPRLGAWEILEVYLYPSMDPWKNGIFNLYIWLIFMVKVGKSMGLV